MDERIEELLNKFKASIVPGDNAGRVRIIIPRTMHLHGAQFVFDKGDSDIEFCENAASALIRFDTDGYVKEGIRNGEKWTDADMEDIAEAVDEFDHYLIRFSREFENLARMIKKERGIRDIAYNLRLSISVNGQSIYYPGGLTDKERAFLLADIKSRLDAMVMDENSGGHMSGEFQGGEKLESNKHANYKEDMQ